MPLIIYSLLTVASLISTLDAAQAHLASMHNAEQIARPLVERIADPTAGHAAHTAADTIPYGQLWWDEVTHPFQHAIDIDDGCSFGTL